MVSVIISPQQNENLKMAKGAKQPRYATTPMTSIPNGNAIWNIVRMRGELVSLNDSWMYVGSMPERNPMASPLHPRPMTRAQYDGVTTVIM